MAAKDTDTTTVTFRISRSVAKRLKLAAVVSERSQQEIAEEALTQWLERTEKPAKKGR